MFGEDGKESESLGKLSDINLETGLPPKKKYSWDHMFRCKDDDEDTPPQVKATAASYSVPTASLPNFSGQEKRVTEAIHAWLFALDCVISEGHPVPSITGAIRRSLKGPAMQAYTIYVRQHYPEFKLPGFRKYMEETFGTAGPAEVELQRFYAMQQGRNEDITTWGLQVSETTVDLAKRMPKMFPPEELDKIRKQRFWFGLMDRELQDATRCYVESRLVTFSELLAEARQIELEYKALPSHKPSFSSDKNLGHALCVDDDVSFAGTQPEGDETPEGQGAHAQAVTPPPTRRVRFAEGTKPGDVTTVATLRDQIATLEARLNSQLQLNGLYNQSPGQLHPRPGACFCCGDPSHYVNRCPHVPRAPRGPRYLPATGDPAREYGPRFPTPASTSSDATPRPGQSFPQRR